LSKCLEKSKMRKSQDLKKEHLGFDKLKAKIAADGGASDPAAVAAKIGMDKYGKKAFEAKAHAGKHKAHKSEELDKAKVMSDYSGGQKRGPEGYGTYQEQAQNQKGVHTPVSGVTAFPKAKGQSEAGDMSTQTYGGKPHKELGEHGKNLHRKKLSEMKAMPKPNLPKSEELDKSKRMYEPHEHHDSPTGPTGYVNRNKGSDLDHGQKRGSQGYPKYQEQAQNEKGVHTPVSGVTGFPGAKGRSEAGDMATQTYGGKPHRELRDHGKDLHRKKLSEIKAMPKPNLPKSEELKGMPKLKKQILALDEHSPKQKLMDHLKSMKKMLHLPSIRIPDMDKADPAAPKMPSEHPYGKVTVKMPPAPKLGPAKIQGDMGMKNVGARPPKKIR
jgi:hypothetical protein